MPRTPAGLFLNTTKAKCSIYQSGCMVFDAIKAGTDYTLDYIELSEINTKLFNETGDLQRLSDGGTRQAADNILIYDFIVFNYHHGTMEPFLSSEQVGNLAPKKFCIVLETQPADAYAYCRADKFDGLIVLDPTIVADGLAWPFPRPLNNPARNPGPRLRSRPVIGSFGFATPGKGFELLMSAVNLEFDEALVRINIPPSTYVDRVMTQAHRRPYAEYLGDLCKASAKRGIDVEITHDFMSETDLIDWCEDNDINSFMYTRRQSGLSATTDQAIIAGRPILTSANDTFRHIHPYIRPYPATTLREALTSSGDAVRSMQADWSTTNFARRFVELLQANKLVSETGCLRAPNSQPSLQFGGINAKKHRVLIVQKKSQTEKTLLDWSERLLQTLKKSVLLEIDILDCEADHELVEAAFWLRHHTILAVSEHCELPPGWADTLDDMERRGQRVARVCRERGRGKDQSSWSIIGPIIPFYTMIQVLPEGNPIINLFGFEGGKHLASVVAKIQRELSSLEIRLVVADKLEGIARDRLARQVSFLNHQLRYTPHITLKTMPLGQTVIEVMVAMASATLNVFCGGGPVAEKVQNLIDLAMATDRAICQTSAEPVTGYDVGVPSFEAQSLPKLLADGPAGKVYGYNRYSEGRALLALEQILWTRTTDAHSSDGEEPSEPTLLSVSPNGALSPTVSSRSKKLNRRKMTALSKSLSAVDSLYRQESIPQQHYLVQAVSILGWTLRPDDILLIGDHARYAPTKLNQQGIAFEHQDDIHAALPENARYLLVVFVNSLSGADELDQTLAWLTRILKPGGLAVLTFFLAEDYEIGEQDGSLDFPLFTGRQIRIALEPFVDELQFVTQPRWNLALPRPKANPFALPAVGTLTLRRAIMTERSKGVSQS